MRLSTHLDPEALVKLEALKGRQKRTEGKTSARTSRVASINGLIRVLPRPASDNPRLYMTLKQVRKELGLSYTEISEQTAISNLPLFEYRAERFLKKADVDQLQVLMAKKQSRLRVSAIAAAYQLDLSRVEKTCNRLRIRIQRQANREPTISARDYDLLRRQLVQMTRPKASPGQRKTRRRAVGFTASNRSVRPGTFISVVPGGLPTLGRGHK